DRTQLAVPICKAPPAPRRERSKAAPLPAGEKRARKKGGAAAIAADSPPLDAAGMALLESLRRWRTEQASREHMPPYCVFHDRTLVAIAAKRPGDLAALLEVPGLGARKAEKYGERVLALAARKPDGSA